jgi:hypothetical protein
MKRYFYPDPVDWSPLKTAQSGSHPSQNTPKEALNSFPLGTDKPIPIIAVAGDRGTGTTARTLDMILRGAARSVGLALRERSFVNGVSADFTDQQQASAARLLLYNPAVDVMVSTVSLREVARCGLMLKTVQLTVIMDKVKDGKTELFHAGLDVVQRATTDCFVVQTGNIVALDRLPELEARQLILVSNRLNDPGLQAHLKSGHRVVVTMGGQAGEDRIVLLSGSEVLASIPANVGSSRDGRIKKRRLRHSIMFAVAAAFGLGLSGAEIMSALRNLPPIIPKAD